MEGAARGSGGPAADVPRQARLRADPGALGRAGVPGRRPAAVRGADPRRAPDALRLPAPGRRRPEVLVGAEGAVRRPRGQAARRAHRGPSAGVRGLRGRDPEGRVRRGHGDRVGPRDVRAVEPRPAGAAGGLRRVAGARARHVPAARRQAARRVRPDPLPGQGRGGRLAAGAQGADGRGARHPRPPAGPLGAHRTHPRAGRGGRRRGVTSDVNASHPEGD
ncbi:hypothetical protein SGPA1_21251 [Streptomyces misionensis JCM 4497]